MNSGANANGMTHWSNLMGEFETEAEFVAASVEVLGVDQRAERHLDAGAKVLSVGHAQLTRVVDLGKGRDGRRNRNTCALEEIELNHGYMY